MKWAKEVLQVKRIRFWSFFHKTFITMKKTVFTADSPLSALFRRTFHDELRQVIDSWRPVLIDSQRDVDALDMCRFYFDHQRITSKQVYMQLIELMEHGALRPSMRTLADYLFQHSNLSRSPKALYEMLGRCRREWEMNE